MAGHDIRILLVEDDPDDVFLMKRALNATGMSIILDIAHNGEEALQLLREQNQDQSIDNVNLILLDLNMPTMDGATFLRHLRADPVFSRIPAVVVTTSDDPDVVHKAYEIGANSVITKATSKDGMMRIMQTIVDYWFHTSHLYYVD